ncbi:MAG TPA: hypothetical protein VF797_01545, partial [Noviherbaspirillum sp.]
KGPRVGDKVQWRCMRTGWLTGIVESIERRAPFDRYVRELDGRRYPLPVTCLTIIERFVP